MEETYTIKFTAKGKDYTFKKRLPSPCDSKLMIDFIHQSYKDAGITGATRITNRAVTATGWNFWASYVSGARGEK